MGLAFELMAQPDKILLGLAADLNIPGRRDGGVACLFSKRTAGRCGRISLGARVRLRAEQSSAANRTILDQTGGSIFIGNFPGALLTAGLELRYLNGESFSARFDSELSDRSRSYGGTGVFRYVW